VRLSHGHIRIGSFQRLAAVRDEATMRLLIDYVLVHLLGVTPNNRPAGQLLGLVCDRTARLAASYMAAGFVHGVLNSDNINLTGESFDYGPWRFAPTWAPGFTAAYFDQQGLYAFGRQAQAIHWDVVQFAISLRLIAEAEELAPPLDGWPERYEIALRDAMFARIGIAAKDDASDIAFLQLIDEALQAGQVGLDRFFFDWRGGERRAASPADTIYDSDAFATFRATIATYDRAATTDHAYWSDANPCSMLIDEVEALWSAIDERDDWTPFEAKIAAIRRMGEAMRG